MHLAAFLWALTVGDLLRGSHAGFASLDTGILMRAVHSLLTRTPMLLLGHLVLGKNLNPYAGPYFIKIKAMGNCPKTEVGDQRSPLDLEVRSVIRHDHTSRMPVMDTNLTLANNVFKRGESQMTLDLAKWDTVSGWREHFLVMPLGEMCFVYEEIMIDIMKAFKMPTKCPVVDGNYNSANAPAKIMPLRRFPSLPYGRYRVYTKYSLLKKTKGPQVRGCMRVVVDVVPQNE